MDFCQILHQADMTQKRTALEFHSWVLAKQKELSATPETKTYARSGAPLPKKFYDEILPLDNFIQNEFKDCPNVFIQPKFSNDNFDAILFLGTGPNPKEIFLEVTYAKDGYDQSLRMEILEKEGRAAATGPVSREGRRGTPRRKVSAPLVAVPHSSLINKGLALVRERLRAKSDKQYGQNHVLIVALDDHYFKQPDDRDTLDEFVSSVLSTLNLDFDRVVISGQSRGFYKSYKILK